MKQRMKNIFFILLILIMYWNDNFFSHFHFNFFSFIFISWRLITLQYCNVFCHTLTWISHGFTCVSHPEIPPTSLLISSLRVIPVHQPWAPCLMHWTWTGNLFHIWWYACFNPIFSNHLTLIFSHRIQKTVLYICVSFAVSHVRSSLPSF